MTDEMISLWALIEKTPDADLVREMIGFAAQRLIGLEVGELTGAADGTAQVHIKAESSHVVRAPSWRRGPCLSGCAATSRARSAAC